MKKQVKLGLTALLMTALCACGGPKNANTVNTANANANQAQAAVESQDQANASAGQVQVSIQPVDEKGYTVSLAQAVDAFKKEYPQAQLTGVSFEEENGNFVYELEGKDPKQDYEFQVHATSGEILKQKQENENNPMIEALDLAQVKTEQEAMAAAKEAAKDQDLLVKSWSLEIENKRPVYEVSLVKGNQDDLEVKLDAKTLEVLDLDM
ncbi:MAG: PepSY domain-containing protein [Peptoniphilus sp. oral taxon 375]|nr:PepSY domain-containing protein [Peptoniphilus sp. oral taxon 375]